MKYLYKKKCQSECVQNGNPHFPSESLSPTMLPILNVAQVQILDVTCSPFLILLISHLPHLP